MKSASPILLVVSLGLSVPAQSQFVEGNRGRLPILSPNVIQDFVAGDVDGDGDLDLITVEPARILMNDGRGNYTDATDGRLTLFASAESLSLGDLDGDGDPDLVVGVLLPGDSLLYFNDGTGRFTWAGSNAFPAPTGGTTEVEFGDVDGDGDMDLLFARVGTQLIGNQNLLFLNDGMGGLTDATATHMPQRNDDSRAVALRDLDGDGDLDLVFANSPGPIASPQNRLYVNDGSGRFTDVTAARFPTDSDNSADVGASDLDGDGDVDLVFATIGSPTSQDRVYLNNGAGSFAVSQVSGLPVDPEISSALSLGDVDLDGDADLLIANLAGSAQLWHNDGSARFTQAPPGTLPVVFGNGVRAALLDLDADGDLDALLGSNSFFEQPLHLLVNDGSGMFRDESLLLMLPPARRSTAAVLVGDLNGDSLPDLLTATDRGFNAVLLGDGTGWYDFTSSLPVADLTRGAALADVDGDGDLDAVSANFGDTNLLWLNDGQGRFTQAVRQMPIDNAYSSDVAAGDFDGDGDWDLCFANAFSPSTLYLNDGSGNFANATAGRLPSTLGYSVEAGDLDGDGDLDLVVAGILTTPGLLLNDGRGTFTDATAQMPGARLFVEDLTLADVDGDGDLDAVFANGIPFPRNALYLNDGSANFSDASFQLPLDTDRSRGVAAGDVDGDGDLDLVFANGAIPNAAQNRIYLNDGLGNFTDATTARLNPFADTSLCVALADIDLDGDLDILFGNDGFQNRLLVNLDRHLLAPRAPYLSDGWALQLFRQPGYGNSLAVALPGLLVNGSPAPTPTPFGTLFLSPDLLPLPWLSIPPATGTGTLVLPVPNDPAFAGSTTAIQALMVDVLGGTARLTNYQLDVIR